MKFKKYFFLEPEPFQFPELAEDGSKKRIKDEMTLYKQLKDDDRIRVVDKGLTYYLISKEWVDQWRAFIGKEGDLPGPINNEPIA